MESLFATGTPSTASTYAWIGARPADPRVTDLIPALAGALAFPSWESFRTSLAELKEPVFAFGPPRGFDGLRTLYLPVPGVAAILVGVPEELSRVDLFGADLVVPVPPDPRIAQAFKTLRKRMSFEADAVRAARVGRASLEALAHDLRTPTTAIIAYAELAASRGDAAMREDMQHIIDNAGVLEDLASRIVGLARAGEASMPLRPKVIAARLVYEKAAKVVAAAAAAKRIRLEADCPDDVPPLWVDPVATRRVLSNILDNAVRASPDGGTIRAEISRAGDCVRFRFLDQGPGLSPELLSRIFMRYQSRTGGRGLGLALAWELVTLHGGVIWAENRPEGGAVFTCTLPSVLREFTIFRSTQGEARVRPDLGELRITLSGGFGREDVATLRTNLLAATEEAENVVLDLSQCQELSSGAIALLVELFLERDKQACRCTIDGISPALEPVLRALDIIEETVRPLTPGGAP